VNMLTNLKPHSNLFPFVNIHCCCCCHRLLLRLVFSSSSLYCFVVVVTTHSGSKVQQFNTTNIKSPSFNITLRELHGRSTGSRSCPMVGFDISGIECPGSAAWVN
jgi:hypothetical protein